VSGVRCRIGAAGGRRRGKRTVSKRTQGDGGLPLEWAEAEAARTAEARAAIARAHREAEARRQAGRARQRANLLPPEALVKHAYYRRLGRFAPCEQCIAAGDCLEWEAGATCAWERRYAEWRRRVLLGIPGVTQADAKLVEEVVWTELRLGRMRLYVSRVGEWNSRGEYLRVAKDGLLLTNAYLRLLRTLGVLPAQRRGVKLG